MMARGQTKVFNGSGHTTYPTINPAPPKNCTDSPLVRGFGSSCIANLETIVWWVTPPPPVFCDCPVMIRLSHVE